MPIRRLLPCLALALAATAPRAQQPPFHLVQRIDEMLVGVDAIALDVVDRDHVAGTYFLVNAHRPAPLVGYANYVVDCREPRRIAILSSVMPSGRLEPEQPFAQPPRRSGAIDPAGLAFGAVHVMDGTAFVAAFTCRASSAPGRAAQIAAELAAHGGPADGASLYCTMQPDSGRPPRRVEVRWSVAEQAVAVNGQWLSSGFLAGDEVVFGTGAQWRVDRRKRTARLVRDDGRQLFKGDCDTRPDAAAAAPAR
ncbi:hypothetical protein [Pseudorhodoferax sp.]|uniref:hypothetical protein n=1 Tax=Pseudorhodoferax sp. TaxID=1993553 RepID=UPI0039E47E3D